MLRKLYFDLGLDKIRSPGGRQLAFDLIAIAGQCGKIPGIGATLFEKVTNPIFVELERSPFSRIYKKKLVAIADCVRLEDLQQALLNSLRNLRRVKKTAQEYAALAEEYGGKQIPDTELQELRRAMLGPLLKKFRPT